MKLCRAQQGVDKVTASTRLSGLRSGTTVLAAVEQYPAGWRAARSTISGAAARHANNRRQRRRVLSPKSEA